MATSGPFAELYSNIFRKSPSWVNLTLGNLRADGVLPASKSGKGAAEYSTSNAVDGMFACVLAESNATAVDVVRRVRAARLFRPHFNPLGRQGASTEQIFRAAFRFVEPLVHTKYCFTAGELIDGLVDSMRSRAFAHWLGEGNADISLEFHDGGEQIYVYVFRLDRYESVIFSFGEEPQNDPPISNVIRVNEPVLKALANTLGPLNQEATAA